MLTPTIVRELSVALKVIFKRRLNFEHNAKSMRVKALFLYFMFDGAVTNCEQAHEHLQNIDIKE